MQYSYRTSGCAWYFHKPGEWKSAHEYNNRNMHANKYNKKFTIH